MRTLALAFVAASLASSSAFAKDSKDKDSKDECHVSAGPNDVVQKSGDVVIEAGRTVENVIALKGTVTLKKGASVKSVISVRGDVNVEAGATVCESVITLGGRAHVDGTVQGSRIAVHGETLDITGDDGEHVSIGASFARPIIKEVLAKIDGCAVTDEASTKK